MAVIRHIPNALTCCNLISGCIAVLLAADGQADWALSFILLGAVFDFFDGFAARLFKVSSPIGKELDSLADDVTFGVAPATILYTVISSTTMPEWLDPLHDYIPYVAFLVAAFSALRLAKFNLDVRQSTSFIGMPTPANALFWGALACSIPQSFLASTCFFWMLMALLALSCWLLVAEIPMFALKFKSFSFKDNKLRYFFILVSLLLIIGLGIMGLTLVILLYILLSLVAYRHN